MSTDTLLLPVANELLTCLCDALIAGDSPETPKPGICCIRVGDSVINDMGENFDECCEGLAYVRIAGFYPTASPGAPFPSPSSDFALNKCAPYAWGLSLEMGIFRCISSEQILCPEWNTIANLHMSDAKAMRAALCCFMKPRDGGSVSTGAWTPAPRAGGCIGSTWTITVEVNNRCVTC